MQSKRTILLALAMLVLIVPFGTGIAAADSQSSHHGGQPLSLSLSGGVLNAGTQDYVLAGGKAVMAVVNGIPLAPGSHLEYHMNAQVSGLSTNGFFVMSIDATNVLGQSVYVLAFGQVFATPYAMQLGCSDPSCETGIPPSEIPTFFLSGSQVYTWTDGIETTSQLAIGIESAYLNPFGGPIVISSMDGSIFVEATYKRATIQWQNVQMGGTVMTSEGKTLGIFTMNVNSFENLLRGTEHDEGTISMTIPQGTFAGSFHGRSVVPKTDPVDCTAQFILPPGTCTMTGLDSTGVMRLEGGQYRIHGIYHTVWAIPAVGFSSTVSGTLFHQQQDNSNNQDN